MYTGSEGSTCNYNQSSLAHSYSSISVSYAHLPPCYQNRKHRYLIHAVSEAFELIDAVASLKVRVVASADGPHARRFVPGIPVDEAENEKAE